MVKQALVVTVLALAIGWMVLAIPLIRSLVWLNAAAISVHFQKPGLFIPMGILEMLIVIGLVWGLLWYVNRRWREVNHV